MTGRWFGMPWSQVQETELAHHARMAIYGNKPEGWHGTITYVHEDSAVTEITKEDE